MFLAYTYTRNTRPFLKLALVSCLTLLFLLGFTFITGGYTNPDSTVYRYTHEYSQKYGSWLQSKLGMKYTTMEDEDGGEEGNDEGRRTFNIALTERAGHHDEVLGAFLYTLAKSPRIINTTVYRNSYRYKFSEIVKPFYPYQPVPADSLFDALNTTFSSNSSVGLVQRHDALILSSCDQTLPAMLPSLLASLSLLQQKKDFKILCVVHDAAHPPRDLARIAGPLVEHGIVTFLVLSDAAARMVKESVFELASGSSSSSSSDGEDGVNEWDRVHLEVFVPIFPAPRLGIGRNEGDVEDLEAGDTVYGSVKPKKRVLSSVIVQGNIDQHRRDYVSLFRDLEEALERDPVFWGYQPSPSGVYEAISSSASPSPFTLHLAGSLLPSSSPTKSPSIPPSLANVVKIHPSLSYPDFFALMHKMDLVLPAFARTAYYKSSASSTVPASVIAEVPILATRRLLNAYQYLDARTSIMRPARMREIEAVRLLRMGVLPDDFYNSKQRRDASWTLDDGYDEGDEDEEVGDGDEMEVKLQEDELESSRVGIDLSDTPDLNSNGDEGPLEDASTDDEIDSAKTCTKESLFQEHVSVEDTEQNSRNKISQGDTTHPRARARSLMNSHSSRSRSLPPGAGSLLPRLNPRRGPIPPSQNHPQNTQDQRAFLMSQNLKRRNLGDPVEDEQKKSGNLRREKVRKLKWDGDMNTLTSTAAIRAMHREVYARNEQVLLRAFSEGRGKL